MLRNFRKDPYAFLEWRGLLGADALARLGSDLSTQLGAGRGRWLGMSRQAAAAEHVEATPLTSVRRERWRAARRFQVAAKRALAKTDMSFSEWLLLEALDELVRETGDAVSQQAVAARAGVSKVMASYWMTKLEQDCLLDRGLGEDTRSYLLLLSEEGAEALARCREALGRAGLTDVEVEAATP